MIMTILTIIFFLEIKESKITRWHNVMLVKKQSRLDVRKFSFSQMTFQQSVYMLVLLTRRARVFPRVELKQVVQLG